MQTLLVTGSSGLIGSEVSAYFSARGWDVHGADNNMRAFFFGREGDTRWNQCRLEETLPRFTHHELDIRDRARHWSSSKRCSPDAIVHAAAQPSHDLAAQHARSKTSIPMPSARSTCSRRRAAHAPEARVRAHVHQQGLRRCAQRTPACRNSKHAGSTHDPEDYHGIHERLRSTNRSTRSSARPRWRPTSMVQEYGRYFGMPTLLPARGMPDRPRSLRRSSCTVF